MTAVEDVEFCHPTEGPIVAYYGRRAAARKTTKGEPLHAVAAWSLLSGAMDAECGAIGAIEVGPWDPGAPGLCAKCAKLVAGKMPMPPDLPVAEVEPEPIPAPVQLAFFFAA